MSMKLWHCKDTRSLRPLWTLEELGLDCEIEVLPFPPRFLQKEYLDTNPLGTVPYFQDGKATMTESTGICHYLVEKHPDTSLRIAPDHPDYGSYINWLFHSDATLTFPQTLVLRYGRFESAERRNPQVVEDYRRWYLARLQRLNHHLLDNEFLCGGRFTVADIAVHYALFLGELAGYANEYEEQTFEYLQRLKKRPAFERARAYSHPAQPQPF
ncbi:glutathione S-transferase family protein [Pseudomaricurvus hydrocarbonicus]|nr:glutathione S-transferase family protein [Aestuariicella hydrocarbonica]